MRNLQGRGWVSPSARCETVRRGSCLAGRALRGPACLHSENDLHRPPGWAGHRRARPALARRPRPQGATANLRAQGGRSPPRCRGATSCGCRAGRPAPSALSAHARHRAPSRRSLGAPLIGRRPGRPGPPRSVDPEPQFGGSGTRRTRDGEVPPRGATPPLGGDDARSPPRATSAGTTRGGGLLAGPGPRLRHRDRYAAGTAERPEVIPATRPTIGPSPVST